MASSAVAAGGPPRDRRDELLDAVAPVLRAEGPDAPMTALAAGAGITKPILYRHFGDKEGLLAAWAERQASALGERITAELAHRRTPRSRIRSTIETYLQVLEDDPNGYWFVTRRAAPGGTPGDGPVAQVAETIVAAVAAVLREELDAAGVDPAPATTWARAIVGMVQLTGDRWLVEREPSREELASRLTDLVWLGFRGLGAG